MFTDIKTRHNFFILPDLINYVPPWRPQEHKTRVRIPQLYIIFRETYVAMVLCIIDLLGIVCLFSLK
jgi:hypothetical protein